ncbi:MAG: High-affnity carbon uptake protein Hat/HatR [Cyclobacteriaceae bacterium]|nr:High-affnity carbon uptake protein Hat/HatR [Cyclobacteriaceae bacterium]
MLNKPLQSGEFEKYSSEVMIDIDPVEGNPFPGLRPFTIDDCHLFFGREGQVDEILVKLSINRFVTVLGYSGSGKSSLMSCGLIPVLYGGFMTQTGPYWDIIQARPGTSPINNLADAIVDFQVSTHRIEPEDRALHRAIINSVLRSGPDGLIEVARSLQTQKGENVFILIDQFEEVFRNQEILGEEVHNETQLYVNLIIQAVSQTKVPIYTALTMRSDFIGQCSLFPGLTELVNNSNYIVPQMTRDQKKMAIEGPVAVGGGKISPRLIKRLLNDIGTGQDQLPILQHALMRTWDYWTSNREAGEPLDIRHYNAIGRITEALSQHANEAYDELTSRQKEIAEVLFKTITEKNQANQGTRRPGRLGLIAELAEAEEQDVIEVVDQFRKPGRSFLMPGANIPLNSDSLIELSHESLMRIWNRLDAWVDEEFDSAQTYKRLSEAAAMYQIGKTSLFRPPDLQLALNWQKKQRPTREWAQRYDETFERAIVFLDTSRITYEAELKNQEMLQRRILRRAKITAIVLGIAFVVAILFFLYANIQRIGAESQRLFAVEKQKEAELSKADALKQKAQADSLRIIAEIAVSEEIKSRSKVEEALKETKFERDRAEKALLIAKIEQQKAMEASEKELEARLKADAETVKATSEYNRANGLYMLTVAQNLATKSVQEEDDENLAGLLAMQGYHYHRRYDGKNYDPYIYRGLYSSLTKLSGSNYNAIKSQGPPHVHIKSLALSTKNSTFYTSGVDGRILQGDVTKLKNTPTGYATPYPSKVIALNPNEDYLINGSDSAFVQVYNLKSKKETPDRIVRGFKGSINDIEFLPDNSGFIVASGSKSLFNVNHLTGELKVILALPYDLKAISISPDGKWLAGAAWTGQVILVDLVQKSYVVLVEDTKSRVLSIKFNPAGNKIGFGIEEPTVSTDGTPRTRGVVKLYDLGTKEIRQFTGHVAGVTDVEFSPNGKLIASAGLDKRLIMWVLDNPEDLPIVMDNNNGFIWDIAFTKGSDYLVAACSESEIRVWPTEQSLLAEQICPKLKRNMTQDEWKKYVGDRDEVKYEITCPLLLIKDY